MSNININLTVTPAGVEFIVKSLRAVTPLPDPNVDAFVAELWAQYQTQAKAAVEAAAAQAAEPEVAQEEAAVGGTD